MARKLRIEFDGAMYHITVRGVERRDLFRHDRDRMRLLDKLAEGVGRYELDVFLYCLMSNHLHLLVGTPRGNLGRFMGWWLTAYTVYFNLKYRRSGHVTQGRYGAKLVEGDEYLLKLSRYIHLNPVQTAAMKKRPEADRLKAMREYRWSSYPGYVSERNAQPFVKYEPLLDLVGEGRGHRGRAYRAFVEQGVGLSEEEWRSLQGASPIAIGSAEFIDRMETLYARLVKKQPKQEDVSFRRLGRRADPKTVLAVVAEIFEIPEEELGRCRRNVWDRAVAARFLVQRSGLTQREAARWLSLGSGGAVSAQMRKLQMALRSNRRLRRRVEEVDRRLWEDSANC